MVNSGCSLDEAWGTLLPVKQQNDNREVVIDNSSTQESASFDENEYKRMIAQQNNVINRLNQKIDNIHHSYQKQKNEEPLNDQQYIMVPNVPQQHVTYADNSFEGIPKNRLVLIGCGVFLLYIFNSLKNRN